MIPNPGQAKLHLLYLQAWKVLTKKLYSVRFICRRLLHWKSLSSAYLRCRYVDVYFVIICNFLQTIFCVVWVSVWAKPISLLASFVVLPIPLVGTNQVTPDPTLGREREGCLESWSCWFRTQGKRSSTFSIFRHYKCYQNICILYVSSAEDYYIGNFCSLLICVVGMFMFPLWLFAILCKLFSLLFEFQCER